MLKKKEFPKESISLDNIDPITQLMVISFFKENGIDVYNDTIGFDPKYPYLYWDSENNILSQRQYVRNKHLVLTEFLNEFFDDEKIRIKLNDNHIATILKEEKMVKVGCQQIPFDKVEELYQAIQKCK